MAGHGDQGAIGAIGGNSHSSQTDIIARLKKPQQLQQQLQPGAQGAVLAYAPNSIWTASQQYS